MIRAAPATLAPLEDADADAAQADDGHRGTRLHLRRVEGGADARGDAAADGLTVIDNAARTGTTQDRGHLTDRLTRLGTALLLADQ